MPTQIAGQPVGWQESEARTRSVRQQLEEYFAGKRRRNFDLELDLRGTEFRKRCWDELLRIPYGETRSYGEIARAVGNPNGFRAVGQANHYNPIAIIVPCHRVLAGRLLPGRLWRRTADQGISAAVGRRSFREQSGGTGAREQLAFTAD